MKIICFSDTHKLHDQIEEMPEGDVLLFAGDMCGRGGIKSIGRFNKWLGTLNYKYKIVVAGNHDMCLEDPSLRNLAKDMITNAVYLEDEEIIIDGIKFYGSPWQPEFLNWAFNLPRGPKLREKWALIPNDTNVLITHGPPHGIMDFAIYDKINVGCQDLADRIQELSELKAHVFGHIHGDYGVVEMDGVTYVNASICTEEYKPTNKPIVLEI
jgi:Icc-related predicted phosphoesterase